MKMYMQFIYHYNIQTKVIFSSTVECKALCFSGKLILDRAELGDNLMKVRSP